MISMLIFKSFLIKKRLTFILNMCKTLRIVKITRLLLTLYLKLIILKIKN